jgi:hypothetical protein
MSAYAYKSKLYPLDILKVTGGKVIAGGVLTDNRLNKVSYKEKKPEIQFFSVPGYGVTEFQFLIEGKGDVIINFESQKAQDKSLKINL